MNYTEAESKVREATSDERWGPTGSMMADIARYTNAYDQFNEVMAMLWRRLFQESRKNWVRPYKCLILLEYLIKHGSEKVINDARDRMFELRILESYQYNDDPTCDHGQKVRSRVKAIIELLQDDDRLYEERKAARHNKTQYIGISSSEYSQGGFHNYRRRRDSSEDRVVESNASRRVENRHAIATVDPIEECTVGSDRNSDLLADVFAKPSTTVGVDNSWPASDDPFAAPQSSAGGNFKYANKLPDTWSDIGKIGLNLDSLSLSDRKDKPNRVTMNEMQNQKKQAAFDKQSSNSTSTVEVSCWFQPLSVELCNRI
ncbi:clathrin interactor 1 [Trichinella spiralis]|uniref:clathrin interactor 1 n=1 Tax=Trichinella spiralis TaxID=6334 RepID=UPI0001EFBA84|nr:clathrin interactor 1 [Trichinella spiralis]